MGPLNLWRMADENASWSIAETFRCKESSTVFLSSDERAVE